MLAGVRNDENVCSSTATVLERLAANGTFIFSGESLLCFLLPLLLLRFLTENQQFLSVETLVISLCVHLQFYHRLVVDNHDKSGDSNSYQTHQICYSSCGAEA